MNNQQVITSQILTPRCFRIHYSGGFAVTNRLEYLQFLLENDSKVNIVEEPTLEKAYGNACYQYSQEYWKKQHGYIPALPTFEAILKMPYHEPNFIPTVSSERYFATIHKDYVGIFDNVIGAMEFLNYMQPIELKEFSNADEAKWWLNEKFVVPLMAMSAYITEEIPYLKDIPMNTALSVHYREWWEKHYQPQDNLPFTKPTLFLDQMGSNGIKALPAQG